MANVFITFHTSYLETPVMTDFRAVLARARLAAKTTSNTSNTSNKEKYSRNINTLDSHEPVATSQKRLATLATNDGSGSGLLLPLLVAKSGKNEVATEKTLTEQRLRDNVASVASVATNFEASPQISGMNETTQQKALSKEPSKPLASDERPLIESAPKSNSTQSINSDDDLIGCETKAEWIASHRSGKGSKPCQPTVRQLDPHKVEIKERGTAAAPESNPLRINYGDDWGANLPPDEAEKLEKVRAEIQAEVSRSPAAIKTVATPADEMPEAARKMEMEAYRRLPETRAAAGLPPVETGTPPLKEQGDYCASRGIEYLEAFWKELNEP